MSSVLRAQNLTAHGFSHGFSTRLGGVSQGPYASLNLGQSVGDEPDAVAENQRRFAAAVGYEQRQLFEINQVHGNLVRVLRAGEAVARVRQQQGDGLVARAGAAVAVRTADCVPILLADPTSRSVAALHAGWRGCVAGVVPAGVQALRTQAEADPSQLIAALFPHIRVCCFEVGPDVAHALAAAASGALPSLGAALRDSADAVAERREARATDSHRNGRSGFGAAVPNLAGVVEHGGERPHVSLERAIRLQLMAAGIPASNIELVAGCTRCDAERFFSFRRDGRSSGRHLAAIVSA